MHTNVVTDLKVFLYFYLKAVSIGMDFTYQRTFFQSLEVFLVATTVGRWGFATDIYWVKARDTDTCIGCKTIAPLAGPNISNAKLRIYS